MPSTHTYTHTVSHKHTHTVLHKIVVPNAYTHTHTHIRTRAKILAHTHAHSHTNMACLEHTHTHTHCLAQTHIYTHTDTPCQEAEYYLIPLCRCFWRSLWNFPLCHYRFSVRLRCLHLCRPLPVLKTFRAPQSVICSKPVSEPHDYPGSAHWVATAQMVHWVATAQIKRLYASTLALTLALSRLFATCSRNVPHTPCKLQRWSSTLNASGSRNVLIIRIIIHWFRHRGCLRAHPRCCHRFVCCHARARAREATKESSAGARAEGESNWSAEFPATSQFVLVRRRCGLQHYVPRWQEAQDSWSVFEWCQNSDMEGKCMAHGDAWSTVFDWFAWTLWQTTGSAAPNLIFSATVLHSSKHHRCLHVCVCTRMWTNTPTGHLQIYWQFFFQ